MKKLLLFLLLINAAMIAKSQECKKYLENDPEDNFPVENVIFSKPVIFSQPTLVDSRTASFRVLDDNRLYFHLSSGNSKDLIYGSDVILTFSDGSDMMLRIEQMHRVKEGSESITHANCRIYTKEDAQVFYYQKITKINLVGKRETFDIDDKEAEKIKHGAICLIERKTLGAMNFSSKRKTKLIPDMAGVSFDAGSSSMVISSGSVKCEFDKDTTENGVSYKLSKSKDIVTSPFNMGVQFHITADKVILQLKYTKDLGCITSDSYVTFKFKDGSTKTFNHAGDEDCSENPVFMIDVKTYKDIFWASDIAMIRLSYSEYYADLGVSNTSFAGSFLRYCLE